MKKILSLLLAVAMLSVCFVIPTQAARADGYTPVLYLTKGMGTPDPAHMYFWWADISSNPVPAEYMTDGYTFEYDVKGNGTVANMGVAYLDENDSLWTSNPWEGGTYWLTGFEITDEWQHVVASAAGNNTKGLAADRILLTAGSGNYGDTAYYKNFVVKNPSGEVVWSLDLLNNPPSCKQAAGSHNAFGGVDYIIDNYPELGTEFNFGISGIMVNEEAGTWAVEIYIDNPGNEFYGDAWFGVYADAVDQDMLYAHRGAAGFAAWDYVWADKTVKSGRTTVSISSSNGYLAAGAPNSIWKDSYPNDGAHFFLAGCDNLQVILFYSDGWNGDGYRIAASVPLNLSEVVETEAPVTEAPATEAPETEAPATEAPKEFTVGVSKVTIDEATGYWRVDCWAENFVGDFKPDAWFGVYDRSVTQAQLSQYRGDAGLSTWAYVKTSDKNGYGDATAPSGRIEFYIDSTNPTGIGDSNINVGKYGSDGLMEGAIGLTDLKIVVFYSDGQFGIDGYIVAGEVDFSLVPEVVETEAPATEAPATEAPATEAPATEAPATEEPAPEVPETEAPAADNADELVGDYFYADGERVGNYFGLVQYENNYYYVDRAGKIVKNTVHYVLNANGYDVAPGNYRFDENGVMSKLTGLVGDCFYLEDGTRAPSYYGLVNVDGAYYYIDKDAKAVSGKVHYVWTTNDLTWADGTAVAEGWYEFDENGALVNPGVRNGLVGDFYYVDDVRMPSYYGLVEIDGSYYYVDKDAKIVKGKSHYVLTTNGLKERGFYAFDENGKMI